MQFLVITIFKIKNQKSRIDVCLPIRTRHHEQKKNITVAKFLIFGVQVVLSTTCTKYFLQVLCSGSFTSTHKSKRGYWHQTANKKKDYRME